VSRNYPRREKPNSLTAKDTKENFAACKLHTFCSCRAGCRAEPDITSAREEQTVSFVFFVSFVVEAFSRFPCGKSARFQDNQ
jgi:hypothetical protein